MNELIPVFILAILTWGVYRIFELYVRRKERMSIIEMLKNNLEIKNLGDQLNLPLFGGQKLPSTWPLRGSLLMIGIGIGLIVGFVIETLVTESMNPGFDNYGHYVRNNIYRTVDTIYLACVSVFGGIGLLIAYFIEQKNSKNNN